MTVFERPFPRRGRSVPVPIRLVAALLALMLLAGCAGTEERPFEPLPPPSPGESAHTLHVISNGWHTGLILARAAIPEERIPEIAHFPDSRYLEFGWGDRTYYPAPKPTMGMALSAALTPTDSVVHLHGRAFVPANEGRLQVVPFTIGDEGLARLVDRLSAAFARPEEGEGTAQAPIAAPGLYQDSLFFEAHGRFHLFNTCNTWIARKILAAGVEVNQRVITADALMNSLRNALSKR